MLRSAFVATALLLVSTVALAGNASYKSCKISNGQIFSCGSWYQGKAVVFKDGAYRECSISNGQIFSCGSWAQGEAVVLTDR